MKNYRSIKYDLAVAVCDRLSTENYMVGKKLSIKIIKAKIKAFCNARRVFERK